jgi:hypothetical protein
MNSIITSTPIKAPLDKSKWILGQTYEYKRRPYPGICKLDYKGQNKGKLVLRCTKCNANNWQNHCECSPQQFLMHKDSEMIRHALKEPDTPDFIKKFKEAKGCPPQEYRSHMKLNEYDYRKGKTDADHIISPNDKTKPSEFWFCLTNKRHRDFIFHYKNNELLPTKINQRKGSSNNLDELKIVFEEFAKQTPTGDIHDILIAMRKRRDVTEVSHIAEVVSVKKEVDEETVHVVRFEFEGKAYWISVKTRLIFDKVTHEEIGEWNATSKSIDFYETDDEEEEETDDEEEDEEEAELVREEAEIAKAKADFAIQMDKREAELKAKKARKEIKNKLPELREALIAKSQAVIDKELKKIADIKSGLFDEQLISNEL